MGAGRTAGWQSWRNLLFMHWPVPSEALRTLIPKNLELDAFEGVTYVGLVPFEMRDIRTSWLPKGFGLNFLETNLRTYVRSGSRAGVYFLSLEASSFLAVRVARRTFGLPYFDARMSTSRTGNRIAYTSSRHNANPLADLSVTYEIGAELPASIPGTLQHFLLERYELFVVRGQGLQVGRVEHPPYKAHAAQLVNVDECITSAGGVKRWPGPPPIVHYSPGVDVRMCALEPVHD